MRISPILATASVLALAACGSGGSSASATGSATGSATSTGTGTAAPSPTPAGPPQLVWVLRDSSGAGQIRAVSATGGSAHTVGSVPTEARIIGAGHGNVAWWNAGTVHVVRVSDAHDTTIPAGAAGDTVLGGAFSPDGSHLLFIDATDATHAALRLVDLGSHAVTVARSITDNKLDVPALWAGAGVAAVTTPGFSDGGAIAARRLDGGTFASAAETTNTGGNACAVAFDSSATHVAWGSHHNLGDDDDSPGPAPNCNTLGAGTLGSSLTGSLSEAHHDIRVLALGDDGTVLIEDQPSAGGFAGISMSPDFGLFTVHGTTKTQLANIGAEGDPASGGLLLSGGVQIAATCPTAAGGGTCHLLAYHGGSVSTLDSLPGESQVDIVAAV
jgi:hypothetical protein